MEKYNSYRDDWGKLSDEHQNFLALQARYTKEIESLKGQLELTKGKSTNNKSKGSNKNSLASSKSKSGQITKNKKPMGNRRQQKKDKA